MKTIITLALALLLVAPVATAKEATPPTAGTRGALDCSSAIPIGIWESVVGSTVGMPNNVTYYSCVGWDESGGEAVYELVLDDEYTVNGQIAGMNVDLDIFFLDGCEEANCIDYGNNMFTSVVGPGTYYIVVDGFNGVEDIFSLNVRCFLTPDPQPVLDGGETCNDAVDLEAAGLSDFSVDLTTYVDHYDSDCFWWFLPGGDAVYSIDLEAGEEFSVTMEGTCDMAMYIMGDCAGGESLACSDNSWPGEPEHIDFVPTFTGTYYLIVDNVWDTMGCPVVVHIESPVTVVEDFGQASSRLTGVFPNPAGPRTNIAFALEQSRSVTLEVYDVVGRKIRSLASGSFGAGSHSVRWDGRDDSGASAPSGVYFARMIAGDEQSREKFLMVR